ncbi:MAG: extracellular solute-binding protein [Alphaproteobacteria bacterium]|nr:extracellular solute-binding protein [Alphaproteobacteria bacterium]
MRRVPQHAEIKGMFCRYFFMQPYSKIGVIIFGFFCTLPLYCTHKNHGSGESVQNSGEREKVLYLSNWADYFPKVLIDQFTNETGIRVVYTTYDSVESLEAQLLLDTQYDLVVAPAWPVFARGIHTGRFLAINKALIPNIEHINPKLCEKLGDADSQLKYGIPYMWGTTGIGYDRNAILARAPDAPLDSWALIFDPRWSYLLQEGHIFLLDSATDVLQAALLYLGLSPNSQDIALWDKSVAQMMKVRPYIHAFEGSKQVENLVTGNSELIQGFSTYVQMAREENTNPSRNICYVIPKEGSVIWIDMMAIPHNAQHPKNAHLFLNFILRPQNIAQCTNIVKAANAVPASYPMIAPEVYSNTAVFPDSKTMERIYPDFLPSVALTRHLCREWCKIKLNYRPSSSFWSFWSFWPFSKLCKKETKTPQS